MTRHVRDPDARKQIVADRVSEERKKERRKKKPVVSAAAAVQLPCRRCHPFDGGIGVACVRLSVRIRISVSETGATGLDAIDLAKGGGGHIVCCECVRAS